jgi:hypothetical protein
LIRLLNQAVIKQSNHYLVLKPGTIKMLSPTPSIDAGKAQIDQIEALQTLEVTGENEKSVWQLLREHPRIILCTFLANCGALLFGYDVLVQGAITALPAFS